MEKFHVELNQRGIFSLAHISRQQGIGSAINGHIPDFIGNKKMIVVFGSINMDLIFNPSRAPAAGETILLKNYDMLPGGKGANQAVAAARMGSSVALASCVGRDGFAVQLLDYIAAEKVNLSLVTTGVAQTGSAVITVEDSGENRIMVAAGTNLEAKADQIPTDMLVSGNTVLMQMETDPAQISKLARRASGKVDRVILNLAPAIPVDAGTLDCVDVLIVNEVEILQLAGHLGLMLQSDFNAAAQAVAQQHDLTCVVTLGGKGAVAYTAAGDVQLASALKIDRVVDTTGAGDAFCGTLAAALDQGQTITQAMNMACAVGSLACLKKGAMASYPTLEEARVAMAEMPPKPGL